jgi:hypothetical protein
MLHIMILIFIFAGKYTDYKTECSSYHAENTFLCMRLNPRGLTPSETGMNDRQGTRNVKNTIEKIHLISVRNKTTPNSLFLFYHFSRLFKFLFFNYIH